MTFSPAFFRGGQQPAATAKAAPTTPVEDRPRVLARGGSKIHHWSFVIHKWTGLFAAVWLAVLGLTGFFLDHPSWRWQNQLTAPSWLTPRALEENAKDSLFRLYQIDPHDQANLIAGGPRGLWFSRDGGATWRITEFSDGEHPQILAIEPDPAQGWSRLWLASDNGVYLSDDGGVSAKPAALSGELVTALSAGASPDKMLGVIDRSRVFRFTTESPGNVTFIDIAAPHVSARPPEVGLNRFVRELHFGRGLFGPTSSLLLNDVGGVGMFVLPLTGLLFWGLPKYWKTQARHKEKRRPAKATKKMTVRWLFRIHSATFGVVSALLVIYLSITGIFVGHQGELGGWMRSVRMTQNVLPPAFGFSSWNGAIEALAAVPGQQDTLILGSRFGLFTSLDAGKSWTLEKNAEGEFFSAALHIRRLNDRLLVANSMASPSLIRDADSTTHEFSNRSGQKTPGRGGHEEHHGGHRSGDGVANSELRGPRAENTPDGMRGMASMFMPIDVTGFGDRLAWKNGAKLIVTDMHGQILETRPLSLPDAPGVPWFTWFLRMHMGTIFWSRWRWVNDVFAIAAVLLAVTGTIRWERKKWA